MRISIMKIIILLPIKIFKASVLREQCFGINIYINDDDNVWIDMFTVEKTTLAVDFFNQVQCFNKNN